MSLQSQLRLAERSLAEYRNQLDHELKWLESTIEELREAAKSDQIVHTNVGERIVNSAGRAAVTAGKIRASFDLVESLKALEASK